MSRPKEYDDEELLLIMAELLAWPTITNVTEYNAAAEKTLSFILGSDQWAEHVTKQTIDRLLKAFRVDGQHRILQARAQGEARPPWLRGPLLPSLLTSPETPAVALQRQLEVELRDIATWATDLANRLARERPADRELLTMARTILRRLQASASKHRRKNLDS